MSGPLRGPVLGLLACLTLIVPLRVQGDTPPKAAIASAHPLATEAGMAILASGGNAFDAAVAVSAVLAVVEPYGSGLGGGGFWLLHRAADGLQVMVDGRERAPLAAHRDLYLTADGEFAQELALNGPLAAAIPGTPAALCHLAERYGRLGLGVTLASAIRTAREGFAVDARYRQRAEWRLEVLRASAAAARQFLVDAQVPPLGHRLTQPDLAATLERIAEHGCAAFYQGPFAARMVRGVREAGGIWTLEDLSQYAVVERKPIQGDYQGWRLVSAPPPSAGGVLLVEMLNMLSALPQEQRGAAPSAHLLTEVMRRAYRDRAAYLGDPDAVQMPLARLTDADYAAGLIRDFDPQRATPSRHEAKDCETGRSEGQDTTHFSILDRAGNRVAATLSINYPFGSGFVPPGTGVLLNDEMDDFSAQPGVPNAYGLVGGEANAIAPGKRMLSSMSPSFLESEDGVAILGTPGGSRIITMVLQAILAAVDQAQVSEWVGRPRIHHQYQPDRLQAEPGALTPAEQDALRALGHRLDLLDRPYGNMQAVFWDRRTGQVEAASDPRGIGSAQVQ
ncbi:gamma-glutamyltransferase [Thiorhodococcus mannitoliphagus]|uniref:Glutathione hydrolase proenzyme n=1 Tax=Thiorhodococcus mannitoliphagus TaxID=329406 RepID=A0A6P1DRF0_9GAMM|nr:gamma-glutamyltransferase [Thiorhodococcus mannitoliphagus]NEX19256.1 gamma-glutamyltransferase [Thiorhodococcus mannitoliphagus]